MSDVFMNILTTQGLVQPLRHGLSRSPTRFSRTSRIKLGGPNLPGDTMKMRGKVVARDAASGVVDVSVVGSNSWGDHVTGTVKVALPKGK
jgi:hypothetical protein